jgi:hypothetical protein
VRTARAPSAAARRLGRRRGAARLTANFPAIEDVKANFFGAHGNVVSGAVTRAVGGEPETLLELPGIAVTASARAVTIHNGTGVDLAAAQDLDGTVSALSLAADGDATIPLSAAESGLHLQIFPGGPQFPDVVTLLVSSEHGAITGQAFVSAVE